MAALTLTAEPTAELVSVAGVPCRLWRATDAEGRVYFLFVHRVASDDPVAQEALAASLLEMQPPGNVHDLEAAMNEQQGG